MNPVARGQRLLTLEPETLKMVLGIQKVIVEETVKGLDIVLTPAEENSLAIFYEEVIGFCPSAACISFLTRQNPRLRFQWREDPEATDVRESALEVFSRFFLGVNFVDSPEFHTLLRTSYVDCVGFLSSN